MTCEMPVTWIPRAATSVATSVSTRPDSKRASAFSRCACDLSPCIATASTPSRPRRLTSRSAPRLVRTNRSVLPRDRVVGVLARDPAGLAVERGGEEQGLALLRAGADDPVDGRAEAHVEHAVGLVEDEELEVVEANGAAGHQVLEAAGRGHQDVGALACPDLLLEADPAVDGGDLEPVDPGEGLGLLDDLGGELTRGGEHERGGAAARLDALDHRDGEGERLARPRG